MQCSLSSEVRRLRLVWEKSPVKKGTLWIDFIFLPTFWGEMPGNLRFFDEWELGMKEWGMFGISRALTFPIWPVKTSGEIIWWRKIFYFHVNRIFSFSYRLFARFGGENHLSNEIRNVWTGSLSWYDVSIPRFVETLRDFLTGKKWNGHLFSLLFSPIKNISAFFVSLELLKGETANQKTNVPLNGTFERVVLVFCPNTSDIWQPWTNWPFHQHRILTQRPRTNGNSDAFKTVYAMRCGGNKLQRSCCQIKLTLTLQRIFFCIPRYFHSTFSLTIKDRKHFFTICR